MPQIYTKDEIDALLVETSKQFQMLKEKIDETGLYLQDLLLQIQKQHEELLKQFQEHINKKTDNGVISPYAR
jgi:uncharacterized protein YcgL (UPF0745 family)